MNVVASDFDLFEDDVRSIPNEEKEEKEVCYHTQVIIESSREVCMLCGEVLSTSSSNPSFDAKHNSSENLQARKLDEKTLYKDVAGYNFPPDVVEIANSLYMHVTQNKIMRGDRRRALVFATIFYSFKKSQDPQSYEKLITLFQLSKRLGSIGLKRVNQNIPREFYKGTQNVTTSTLVKETMMKFNANDAQIDEVVKLYERVKNKSSSLNRCRPQSLASSLVYFWISKTKDNISIKKFTDVVKLSETTINKIIKEINEILSNT